MQAQSTTAVARAPEVITSALQGLAPHPAQSGADVDRVMRGLS